MGKYLDYIMEQLEKLLAIDSPSGFTGKVTDYLMEEYRRLGYQPEKTRKGGVLVNLGGEGNAVLTMAHVDTLGAMVAEIKDNGNLRLTRVGGLNADNVETENCRVYTLDGRVYEGAVQLKDASIHVNGDYQKTERTFDSVEVLLDANVSSKDEVKALGIANGSFVCLDPRTRITESGYIKSRFLDDKLSTAILLGYAKYLKEEGMTPSRKVYSISLCSRRSVTVHVPPFLLMWKSFCPWIWVVSATVWNVRNGRYPSVSRTATGLTTMMSCAG